MGRARRANCHCGPRPAIHNPPPPMCGIAGIFAFNNSAPPADRAELRAIRDHMVARGPDGHGEWFSENARVAFGHRRLSIIDLSERGAQPMTSAEVCRWAQAPAESRA